MYFRVIIDYSRCGGCQVPCIESCPEGYIYSYASNIRIAWTSKACSGCNKCVELCSNNAITVKQEDGRPGDNEGFGFS